MKKRIDKQQLPMFDPNGGAINTSHVAGVAGNVPAGNESLKANFSSLENIYQQMKAVKAENDGSIPTDMLLKTIRSAAILAPAELIQQRDNKNYRNQLNQIGFLSAPLLANDSELKTESNMKVKVTISVTNENRLNSYLHSVVYGASHESSFGKFARAWAKVDSEGNKEKKFKDLTKYCTDNPRGIALEVLRHRIKLLNKAAAQPDMPREQIEMLVNKAFIDFIETIPEQQRNMDSGTQENLKALVALPHATQFESLLDDLDKPLLEKLAKNHSAKFISIYEKEIQTHLSLMDKTIEDATHPLHGIAEQLYCARWGQLMEALQGQLNVRGVSHEFFPPMSGLSSDKAIGIY